MPTILRELGNKRLYARGPKDASRYFISELGDSFRRMEISKERCDELQKANDFMFDALVSGLLTTAKAHGYKRYYETSVTDNGVAESQMPHVYTAMLGVMDA